jgi:hypothetical protein
MAEWWNLTPEEAGELTNEEKEVLVAEKQVAYFNTYYGSEHGRQVMADLMRKCYEVAPGRTAEAALALIELYQGIRADCGINDEKAVIDAEMKTI